MSVNSEQKEAETVEGERSQVDRALGVQGGCGGEESGRVDKTTGECGGGERPGGQSDGQQKDEVAGQRGGSQASAGPSTNQNQL